MAKEDFADFEPDEQEFADFVPDEAADAFVPDEQAVPEEQDDRGFIEKAEDFVSEAMPDMIRGAAGGAFSSAAVGDAAVEGVQAVGTGMGEYKESLPYKTSPLGLTEAAWNVPKKVGEYVREEGTKLAKEGKTVIPAEVWRDIGTGAKYIPDLISAFTAAPDLTKQLDQMAAPGMTGSGEKVARTVEQGIAYAEKHTPLPDAPGGSLTTVTGTEAPRAAEPLVGSLQDLGKRAETIAAAETKAKALTEELSALEKAGDAAIVPSEQETGWMSKLAELQAERDTLATSLTDVRTGALLKERSAPRLQKIDELSRFDKNPDLIKLGQREDALAKELEEVSTPAYTEAKLAPAQKAKEQYISSLKKRLFQLAEEEDGLASQIKNRGGLADTKLNDRLKEVSARREKVLADAQPRLVKLNDRQGKVVAAVQNRAAKLQAELEGIGPKREQVITDTHARIKSEAEALLDGEDRMLNGMIERVNKLDDTIVELKAKYQEGTQGRLAKKVDSLRYTAAKAENDLVDMGYTSEEVNKRIGDMMDRNIIAVSPQGNEVSQEMMNAIGNMEDFSDLKKSFGQLRFNLDDLDAAGGNGAFTNLHLRVQDGTVLRAGIEAEARLTLQEMMTENGLSMKQSKDFGRFIEGKGTAPAGQEKAWTAAKDKMRAWFDKARLEENALRTKRNEPLIPYREDYLPAMQERLAAEDVLLDPKDIEDYLRSSKKRPSTPYDKARFDLIPEEERLGAFEAMEAYAGKHARYMGYSDVVDTFRTLASVAKKAGKPGLAEYLSALGNVGTADAFRLGAESAKLATGYAFGKGTQAWWDTRMQSFVDNVMSYNVNAAINQVNSAVLTSQYLGFRGGLMAPIEGSAANLADEVAKAALSPEAATIPLHESRVLKLVEIEEKKRLMGNLGKEPENWFKSGFLRSTNRAMYIGTWRRAFKAAQAQGLVKDAAVKFADEITARSQGIYEDMYRPLFLTSSVGRRVAPLSTYVFNAANALAKDWAFASMSPLKKMEVLGHMAGTMAVTGGMTFALTGRSTSNAADFVPLLRAAQYGLSGVFGLAGAIGKGDPRKSAEAAAMLYFPGGGLLQGIKTTKGAANILSGENSDPRQLYSGPLKSRD